MKQLHVHVQHSNLCGPEDVVVIYLDQWQRKNKTKQNKTKYTNKQNLKPTYTYFRLEL